MKKVYGIGVNDADYAVKPIIDGKIVECPFYRKWKTMLERCYSKEYQKRRPSYLGCTVDNKWHHFMAFREWMEQQEWEGKELDKDLLVKGNKKYSSDTCLFVSKQVNLFMTDSSATRGIYPIGVTVNKSRYQARCRELGGKQKHLGLYDTPEEAHSAYKKFKAKLAIELAEQQSDGRIAKALLERYT